MSDYIPDIYMEQTITRRVRIQYTLEEQILMKNNKQITLLHLDNLDITGKSKIFENQELTASNIVYSFKDRKIINILVCGKTQSGKTGSMCATIKYYLDDANNLIPIDNIYIITGLSSCEWKEQTKERMPENIQARVFHRSELPKTFINEIKNKKNVLIIMDEIQVAAQKNQTIYNSFKAAGLMDKAKLCEHDIKILEYTATPNGTVYDLNNWKENSIRIIAQPGEGYISSYDLLRLGRVKQYKDLCGYIPKRKEVDERVFENIKEIKTDIDNYNNPLYHIIRTKNGNEHDITINNFKKIFNPDYFNFIEYDKESEIEDINKTLIIQPEKHTFIFIKEMLRCAKTLIKTYIGISYERYTRNPDDSVIIQGLVGRDTGYDNNGISICYTNIETIEKYEKLWISNFNDRTVKWNSKTTKFINGILLSKNTFNDPSDYDGFSVSSEESIETEEPQPIIKKKDFKELKEWFKLHLKPKGYGIGPKTKKEDANGFYSCITQFDKEQKIRTNAEFEAYEKDKKWGFRGNTQKSKDKNKYRVYPVYSDANDKTTLEWWLVYY